jgi:tRNA(Ile)-lysidine synthase TilS/MesJ
MHTDIPSVIIHEDGECNFCKIHNQLEKESQSFDFNGFVEKLKRKKVKYHCLIGISGGIDSSFLLEYTVKTLKLTPLVIHFDNGWNTEAANHNMEVLVNALNVDFIRYQINRKEYDMVCKSLLMASVSDADIANDMVMAYFMTKAAKEHNIKWIFNGHDFRCEGTSPLCWSYMDAKYLVDINFKMGGPELKHFVQLTFWQQLKHAVGGIKNIRPLYYIDYVPNREIERLGALYGWKPYGPKHSENTYTWFVGAYLLPEKFKIDKRITYLSALTRSEFIIKYEAEYMLKQPIVYDKNEIIAILRRLEMTWGDFTRIMAKPRKLYTDFETYKTAFKKWKWLLWVCMKLRFIPRTFYIKYTS